MCRMKWSSKRNSSEGATLKAWESKRCSDTTNRVDKLGWGRERSRCMLHIIRKFKMSKFSLISSYEFATQRGEFKVRHRFANCLHRVNTGARVLNGIVWGGAGKYIGKKAENKTHWKRLYMETEVGKGILKAVRNPEWQNIIWQNKVLRASNRSIMSNDANSNRRK